MTNGFHYLVEGFKLLKQPGIKRFVLIPLLINIILFCAFFFIARHFFAEANLWVMNHLPAWLQWLGGILWVIFFIGFFLIFIYTFVTVTNLISAPFNAFLAEKVESHLTGKTLEERTLWENIKDTPRILARQFSLIGYYLPRALVLLIFFFVPIIQIFAAVLWFGFNAWFMTLQYLDYPTDNHRIPLTQVHAWLGQNRLLSLTFGMGILIATMIPIVNFLIVPAAVAGATKLWVEKNK